MAAKISQSTLKKYKDFARAYVANKHNGTQAAITAGYAANSAHVTSSKMLNIPKVQEFITQFEEKVSEEFLVTAKEQYEKHQKVYDMAMEIGQLSAANSAVKAQSELCGIEAPKKTETTINGGISLILPERCETVDEWEKS